MQLHRMPKTTKSRKRVGRGNGSGSGKTAGRGTKGQKSRAGHHMMPVHFEGGQMPLTQRLPKLRGFRNPLGYEVATVTLRQLEKLGQKTVSLETLREAGLATRQARVLKVIGNEKITVKLSVTADRASAGAQKAIAAAGGTIKITQPKADASTEKAA